MINKKDLIIVALATFCMTAILFMTIPTRSSSTIGGYDPWVDLNDDGSIDIFDAITLADAYGTKGIPINKTELLELKANYFSLEANYSDYVASYQKLRDEVNNRVGSFAKVKSYITPADPLVNVTVYSITGGWSNRSDVNEYWRGV